ncbi:MAG: hypothetical protein Q9174_005230 [Haloplaca sp. 1 TL-2023]
MDANVLSLVTIFLPLSSLWASASIDNRKRHSNTKPLFPQGKVLASEGSGGTSGPLIGEKFLIGHMSPSETATSRSSQSNPPSPTPEQHQRGFVDLEAGRAL